MQENVIRTAIFLNHFKRTSDMAWPVTMKLVHVGYQDAYVTSWKPHSQEETVTVEQ